MLKLQLLLCLAIVWQHYDQAASAAASGSIQSPNGGGDKASRGVSVLENVLRGKSRQSRCVRCYEDRYYGGSSGDRYGSGYGSRSMDDGRGSWYYSSSGYDRYDDRGGSAVRDYDRYYDRYSPRTYDRYEGRGYDDYRRTGGGSGGGSSSYDRGYGYENRDRDRYYSDRYNDRDRYYDRYRSAGYDRYERDPYDRYYSSSSYGGRPRPLGGSYLFDRDSNVIESQSDSANGSGGVNGGGVNGEGGAAMPAAAAQTAPGANGDDSLKKEDPMQ